VSQQGVSSVLILRMMGTSGVWSMTKPTQADYEEEQDRADNMHLPLDCIHIWRAGRGAWCCRIYSMLCDDCDCNRHDCDHFTGDYGL